MSKFAAAAKTFLFSQRFGALSTLSSAHEGAPFGSIVQYDIHEQGEIVIYVSLIAEHYRNLRHDPRASLLVAAPWGVNDPQAHPRAAVSLSFSEIEDEQGGALGASFSKRFPSAVHYSIAHNFRYLSGIVERIRWIGGFGDIGWVTRDEFREAPLDPISYYAPEIVDHMNCDHLDNLREIVAQYGAPGDDAKNIRMIEISSAQIGIQIGEGNTILSVPLPTLATTPADARNAIRSLLEMTRAKRSP